MHPGVKARLDAAVEPTVSLATPWMGFVEEGQVLSVPYDTGQFSEWKYLTWEATTPPSTTVGLRLRTAATAEGLSAAPWIAYGESGLLVGADNEHPNDAGRWVQYEATLTSTDPYTTPALHQVTVYYTGHPATLTVGLSPETVLAGEASTCTASVDDGEHTWDVTGETDFNIVEGGHGGAWASNLYTSAMAGGWTVKNAVVCERLGP